MTLHYVSLFSGIEAFSVAASRIADVDWRPVFFSEIDPFPCAVLAHHFPQVPNLGDICKIRIDHDANTATNGTTTVALPRAGIDILAGGSPCQDVSVAGKRAGMSEGSGTRSSLAFEYARLVRELRPRVVLWENVPGVFSANGGRDFAAFLHTLDELGYSLAWRVLDCQYTRVDSAPRAVPQRRRRVWLVGCLGGDGRVPAQILFERAGLLGDTPPRREAGKGFAAPAGYGPARDDRVVAGTGFGETGQGFWQSGIQAMRADHQGVNWPSNVAVTPCGTGAEADRGGRGNDAGEGDGTGGSLEVAAPLCAADGKGKNGMDICGKVAIQPAPASDCLTPGHPQTHRVFSADGAFNTLTAGERSGQNQREVLVESASFVSGDHKASCDGGDVANTIPSTTGGFKPGAVAVATFENHGQDSRVKEIEVSDTRSQKDGTGGNNLPLVVASSATFGKTGHAVNAQGEGEKYAPVEVAQTLNTFQNQNDARAVDLVVSPSVSHIVRRLTPGECETLMAFPQGWTKIPYRGKPADQCPDSPRYKAIGNSWATNCAEWILRRIVAAVRLGMC